MITENMELQDILHHQAHNLLSMSRCQERHLFKCQLDFHQLEDLYSRTFWPMWMMHRICPDMSSDAYMNLIFMLKLSTLYYGYELYSCVHYCAYYLLYFTYYPLPNLGLLSDPRTDIHQLVQLNFFLTPKSISCKK